MVRMLELMEGAYYLLKAAAFIQLYFSGTGMARKEEHLTPGQKILAIRFVSLVVLLPLNVSSDFFYNIKFKYIIQHFIQ